MGGIASLLHPVVLKFMPEVKARSTVPGGSPVSALPEKHRILVAEDHEDVRLGIVRELSRDDELRVVGDVPDGGALLEQLGRTHCELVVLDLSMPGVGGLDVLESISQISPGTKVLVYSLHDEPEFFLETLARGVRGYVLKSESPSVLRQAARRILRGRTYFSTGVRHYMRDNHSLLRGRTSLQLLAEREHQVLSLMREGKQRREIARELELTLASLERLIGGIMVRVGVRTDAGLVQFAREMDETAHGRSLPGVTSGHAAGPTGRSVGGHSA